jgi:hypothetical protein
MKIQTVKPIESSIHSVRGEKVILDADLAAIYGVTSKRLNESVRRNRDRFPSDFCFQLTAEEWQVLRSQIATSKMQGSGGRRHLLWVFTEHKDNAEGKSAKSKRVR